MTGQTPEGKQKRKGRMMSDSQQGDADGGGGKKRLSSKQQRKEDEDDIKRAQRMGTKERAEIRQQISEVHKNIENKSVEESLAELDAINKRIGYTRELYKNTEVVADLAHLTEQRAVELAHAAKRYDWKRFLEGLQRKEEFKDGGRGLNWIAIGAAVAPCFRSVPECEFLLGPLEKPPKAPPKKEKKRKQEEREESEGEAEMNKPGQVAKDAAKETEVAKDAAKETEDIGAKRVKGMLGVMKATFKPGQARTERQQQAQPAAKEVDAFSFLFDPESFTQTVENIFDLSFLCKERQASFALNEEGVPVVRPPSGRASHKNTQAVLSLSMAEWQALCEGYQVDAPRVPHREGYKKDDALVRMMGARGGSQQSAAASSSAAAASSSE